MDLSHDPDLPDSESERQTLVDLVEHTQSLLKSAQDSALHQQQDQSEQYRLLELRLGSQLKLLKDENASLKEELERLNQTQGLDGMSLKVQMLKEMRRVELKAEEREAELMGLVESARHELQIYKGHFESRAKGVEGEKTQIGEELDSAKQDAKRIHTHYSTQIQDLKGELAAAVANLRKATEDVARARTETANLQELEREKLTKAQANWEQEKNGLLGQIKRLGRVLVDKEKTISGLMSATEIDKHAELTPLKAHNETLALDKFALKQQIDLSAALHSHKERSLQAELERWKKLSTGLSQQKGKTGSEDLDHGRLLALLMELEEVDELVKEKLQTLETYTRKLTSALDSDKSGDSGDEKWIEIIKEKEEQVDRLLEIVGAKTNDFDQVKTAGNVFEQLVQSYENELRTVAQKAGEALDRLGGVAEEQLQALSTQNEELSSLRSENQDLRTQLEEAKASTQLSLESQLTEDLMQSQLELDHAKKTIMTYMESIQALEVLIEKNRTSGEVETTVQESIERLKLEVARLTQENTNLVDTKQKAEEAYTAATAKLREVIENKSKESATLKTKLSQEKARTNERIQAVSAKIAEALATAGKANEEVRTHIAEFGKTLPDTVQIRKAWTETEAEAIKVLKEQVQERETLITEIRSDWKAEVASLCKFTDAGESDSWRYLLSDAEQHSKSLSELSSGLSEMLQTLAQLAEALSARVDGSQDLAQTEVEALQTKLAAKQQEHEQELELVRSKAEAEVRSVQQIESALTAEINALRAKVKELKTLSH